MKTELDVLFSEVQTSKPGWLTFFVIGIVVFISVLAILQLFFRIRVGTHPASNGVIIIIWVGIGILLPLLFFKSNLQTAVLDDGIHYRFFPFHLRERVLKKEEIREFRQVTYNPLKDYGGYGIRLSRQGWAYNTRGDKGILVTTTEGKNILFGTQVPEDFENALRSMSKGR